MCQISCSTSESRRKAVIFFTRTEVKIIIVEKANVIITFSQSSLRAKKKPETIVRIIIAAII